MFELRLLDTPREHFVRDLPCVKRGSRDDCWQYATRNGFRWKAHAPNIVGGYYVNPNGDVLYLVPLPRK